MTGKVGYAIAVGSNALFVSDAPALRCTNGLTLEGWILPRSVAGTAARTILSKCDFPNLALHTNTSYWFGLTNGLLYFSVSATGSDRTNVFLAGPDLVPVEQWSYAAATYDGAALRLYLNGAKVAETNYTGGIFPGSCDVGLGGIANYPYCTGRPWQGSFDEISIYNRALSDLEISSIFAADLAGKCLAPPSITAGPVNQAVPEGEDVLFGCSVVGSKPLKYLWYFNGQPLADATNSSLVLEAVGTNRVGSYSVMVSNSLGQAASTGAALSLLPPRTAVMPPDGLVSWWAADNSGVDAVGTNTAAVAALNLNPYVAGKTGQAFNLKATNIDSFTTIHNSFKVANGPSLWFMGNAAFSLEGWVKASSVFPVLSTWSGITPPDTNQPIVAKWASASGLTPARGFGLCIYRERLACWVTSASGYSSSSIFVSGGPKIRDNMFHHVGLTLDRTTARCGSLYVDGQPVVSFDTSTLVGTLSNTAPLYFGTAGSMTDSLNGLLDEIGLYNRALSAAEVQSLYLTGAQGKVAPPPAILAQPMNLLANVGQSAEFIVTAAGFRPMYYQWFKDGVPIANATSNRLVLTNLALADAAAYSVLLTNRGGTLTSAVATLTVNRLPNAASFSAVAGQDRLLAIPVTNLLSVCSDPDGDPLFLSAVSSPSTQGASVVLSADTVSFTASPGFTGSDSFSFTVSDGRGGSASGLVLVRVYSNRELAATLLPPALLQGGYRLQFVGVPGAAYTLERAETLGGRWTVLATLSADPTGKATFSDTAVPTSTAFYRVSFR